MNLNELDLSSLPSPLSHALQSLVNEDPQQPFRQVHRLIDVIEVFCKLYTVASVSQLAGLITSLGGDDHHSERLDKMKAMLSAGLKTPSMGVWWMFARESASVIQELGREHILPDGSRMLTTKQSKLKQAFDGNNNLIAFRNAYAHGATPSDADCQRDVARYGEVLCRLVAGARELSEVAWLVTDEQGQARRAQGLDLGEPLKLEGLLPKRCYLKSLHRDELIDLHPLLCYRHDEGPEANGFYFYNDLRSKYASLLNYPEAAHLREIATREALLERFPIDRWKQELKRVELNPFRERIEELIEVFKGRRPELTRFVEHLTEHSEGFFMLWGPPGVGKSALLARFAELIRWAPERRAEAYPELEWPDHHYQIVDYYIRRGSSDKVSELFDSINQRLDAQFKLNFKLGDDASEKQRLFLERLKEVAGKLAPNQRLVLIFDGLDEAPPELLKLLPRSAPQQIPEQVLVFYGARPQRELKYNFYDTLERERRSELSLEGLSVQDTRALLYEHVNKYELESSFVEAVAEVSEGNPLYLKLLCQGLEQGLYKLNDAKALPKEMSKLYENALVRMQQEHPESGALLCLLAAAKDGLSLELMSELKAQSSVYLESGPLSACYELLTQRTQLRLTTYQLFHESLREHLYERFSAEVYRYEDELRRWCCDWVDEDGDRKHTSTVSLRYAMRFAIPHSLDKLKRLEHHKQEKKATRLKAELLELINDEAWRRVSFEATGHGEAMRLGFTAAQRFVMDEPSERASFNDVLRYALWYHEEPRRFYEEQRQKLSAAPKRGEGQLALEQISRMAMMGSTPKLKLLLALSALWAPPSRPHRSELPDELLELVDAWLEEARDPNLEDIWSLSYV